jgi:hypothetical protein
MRFANRSPRPSHPISPTLTRSLASRTFPPQPVRRSDAQELHNSLGIVVIACQLSRPHSSRAWGGRDAFSTHTRVPTAAKPITDRSVDAARGQPRWRLSMSALLGRFPPGFPAVRRHRIMLFQGSETGESTRAAVILGDKRPTFCFKAQRAQARQGKAGWIAKIQTL